MVRIEYGNVLCKAYGIEDEMLRYTIADKLSYYTGGFGQPKELHVLFNPKTCMTYTGLIPYVVNECKKAGLPVEIVDKRVKPAKNTNFETVDWFQLRDYQQTVYDNLQTRTIVQACTGAGKAMPLDTDILTPNGFVKLRDIHVGSIIYDEDGNETTVIAEHPQKNLKQEYKITFDDGSYAICCNEHLWKYQFRTSFGTDVWHEDSLQTMIDNGILQGRSYKMAIPVCKPIPFSKKNLLIHPYVMGALLGDGGFSTSPITFTNVEQDIIDKVNGLISDFGFFKHRTDKKHIQLNFNSRGVYRSPFTKYIRDTFNNCTSEDKFIPNEYKMSSIEDRIALLQGLFDTDGSVSIPKGHIRFETVSARLAKDIQFVCRSLGIRTKINKCVRTKGTTYKLNICGRTEMLTTSKKHSNRLAECSKPNKDHHYDLMKVVAIEKLNKKSEMKCLTVDSSKHTYICNDFIVTHNTAMMASAIEKFDVKPVIVLSPKATLAYQLRDEISKFLGVKVGIMTGLETDVQDITVVTPQTVLKSKLLEEAKALLVDECQFLGAKTLFDVARGAKNAYYRCAVSATPWRDGNDDLLIEAAINVRNPKSNINASTLIRKGKLTPCNITFVPQEDPCGWLGNYEKTYDTAIVNNKERNNKVLNIIDHSIKNNQGSVLVLFGRINHGMHLKSIIVDRFGSKPVDVEYKNKTYHLHTVELISGETDMEMRNAILEGARQEKVKILLGSTIADEGLDCPALKVLILTASGKSSTRAFQRVGRVLRLFEGRNQAYVYDFMDKNPTFYKHYLYRKALYETEPEWKKNIKVANF